MLDFRKRYAYSFWVHSSGRMGTYAGRTSASSSLSVRNSDLVYNISFDDIYNIRVTSTVCGTCRHLSINDKQVVSTWTNNEIRRIAVKYSVSGDCVYGEVQIYTISDSNYACKFRGNSSGELIFE